MITAQQPSIKSRKQPLSSQPQPGEDYSYYYYDEEEEDDEEEEEEDNFEEAPASESYFQDIMVLSHRQRRRRPATAHDDSDRDDVDGNKDRFIELAQAALEEATLEDERKGVIYEVVEALIAKTGAPLVAEVISEQLRSQEVIEKLAESHEEEEEQRRRRSKQNVFAPSLLKEPPDAVLQPMDQVIEQDDNHDMMINGDNEQQQAQNGRSMSRSNSSMLLTAASTSNGRTWLISEYIWRLFRILLLASLVGLVYHFMCAYHQNLF